MALFISLVADRKGLSSLHCQIKCFWSMIWKNRGFVFRVPYALAFKPPNGLAVVFPSLRPSWTTRNRRSGLRLPPQVRIVTATLSRGRPNENPALDGRL